MGKHLNPQGGLQATGKRMWVTFLKPLQSIRHCAESFLLSHVSKVSLVIAWSGPVQPLLRGLGRLHPNLKRCDGFSQSTSGFNVTYPGNKSDKSKWPDGPADSDKLEIGALVGEQTAVLY